MRKKFSLPNLVFNMVVALLFAAVSGFATLPVIAGSIGAGTLLSFTKPANGVLYAGIAKEIWTDILLEGFYPSSNFLSEARDMSELVEFNTINLAEAGAGPSVLIDNSSYPITVTSRTDLPKTLPLKTLDTTSTVVRNIEKKESSYDKMSSVIYGHKQELLRTACKLAAWNYAPASDATLTPVIAATGALTNGYRKMLFDDLLTLIVRLNNADVPEDGRILVLNPRHEADLIAQDLALYKSAIVSGTLFGMKLYRTSATPIYNATNGAKCAFGAAAVPASDTFSSFFFQKDEVMKAMGDTEMFVKYNDPDNKGDVLNFQMRFVALSLRAKGFGAIYSPRS